MWLVLICQYIRSYTILHWIKSEAASYVVLVLRVLTMTSAYYSLTAWSKFFTTGLVYSFSELPMIILQQFL